MSQFLKIGSACAVYFAQGVSGCFSVYRQKAATCVMIERDDWGVTVVFGGQASWRWSVDWNKRLASSLQVSPTKRSALWNTSKWGVGGGQGRGGKGEGGREGEGHVGWGRSEVNALLVPTLTIMLTQISFHQHYWLLMIAPFTHCKLYNYMLCIYQLSLSTIKNFFGLPVIIFYWLFVFKHGN